MKNILFLSMLFSFSANATSTGATKIQEILVGNDFGTKVFLELTDKPSTPTSCNTNGRYTYVFDGSTELGKMMLSIALTAFAAQKDIVLGGNDICSLHSNVETLKSIRIQK